MVVAVAVMVPERQRNVRMKGKSEGFKFLNARRHKIPNVIDKTGYLEVV